MPHLHGYMELERSFRRSHVLKILPSAHWEGANGDSLANYRYCTKDGRYDVIGDFSREEIGQPKTAKKPISSSIIIKALLNPMTSLQAKLTKEYAFRDFYFDKIVSQVKVVETQISLFNRFRNSKLFPWQYQCLKLLMDQGPRQILWLVVSGGLGKTYFGHYLCGNYGFKMLDGNVSSRDLGQLLKGNEHGFCFDVCRLYEQHLLFRFRSHQERICCIRKVCGKDLYIRSIACSCICQCIPRYDKTIYGQVIGPHTWRRIVHGCQQKCCGCAVCAVPLC